MIQDETHFPSENSSAVSAEINAMETTNRRKENLSVCDKELNLAEECLASKESTDEYLFAKCVYSRLCTLSESQKKYAKKLINDVLCGAEMNNLHEECKVNNGIKNNNEKLVIPNAYEHFSSFH